MEQRRIDPIKTSEHIRETYLRYLNTTFGLKYTDLAEQFREIAWQSEGLFRGPILEVAPKYKKGGCLLDLIDEGILSSEFLDYAPGSSEGESRDMSQLESGPLRTSRTSLAENYWRKSQRCGRYRYGIR